jgi:hypothetical protein
VDVGPLVVPDAQAAVLIQPRERALHHPPPQAADMLRAAHGHQRENAACSQTRKFTWRLFPRLARSVRFGPVRLLQTLVARNNCLPQPGDQSIWSSRSHTPIPAATCVRGAIAAVRRFKKAIIAHALPPIDAPRDRDRSFEPHARVDTAVHMRQAIRAPTPVPVDPRCQSASIRDLSRSVGVRVHPRPSGSVLIRVHP